MEKRELLCFTCETPLTVARLSGPGGLQWFRVPNGCSLAKVVVMQNHGQTYIEIVQCEACTMRLEKGGMPS